jgi:AraC-like DNA-binding protein
MPAARSRRESTVAVSLLADVLRQVERAGRPAADALRAAGIAPDATAHPDGRVPTRAMAALWAWAVDATGDADLGLHATEHSHPGALGLLGYLMLTSATVHEALALGVRYFALLNDGFELAVEDGSVGEARALALVLRPRPGAEADWPGDHRQLAESVLLGAQRQVAQLVAREAPALEVRFRHAAPANTREHARLFGAPVRFAQPHDALLLPAAVGDWPVHAAHPALHATLRAQADQLLASVATEDPVRARARRAIALRLRAGPPRLELVARDLAMSPRAVQRALAEAGGTYQALVDDVRRELALRLLEQPGATAAEVALATGFAEAASFSRAFRRWTGRTPGAVARARRG